MSAKFGSSRPGVAWRRLLAGLGALALVGPGPARGAAIGRPGRAATSVVARQRDAWERYFRAALEQRRLDVEGPGLARRLVARGGPLPQSAFVDYMRWRRGLNAAQFDRFHPALGRLLAGNPVAPVLVQPSAVAPPVVARRSIPQDLGPPNRNVPEPPAAAVALGLIGAVAWARRRNRGLARPLQARRG